MNLDTFNPPIISSPDFFLTPENEIQQTLTQSEPITVTVDNEVLTVDFLGYEAYDVVYQETTPYFLGDLEGALQAIQQLIEHLEDNPTPTQFDKFFIPVADPTNPISNPLFADYDYINTGFVMGSDYTAQFILMAEVKTPNFSQVLFPWQTWVQFNSNDSSSIINDSSVFDLQNITTTTEINEETAITILPENVDIFENNSQTEQNLLLSNQTRSNHFLLNNEDQLTIEVDGKLLEVNFSGQEPYENVFSDTSPYFLGDFTGALQAQQQIVELIESNPETTAFGKFYTPIADLENPISGFSNYDYVLSVVIFNEESIVTGILMIEPKEENYSPSLSLPWQTWVEYTPVEPINYIDGTLGSDLLEGSSAADQINGKQGNDTLAGLQGDDDLIGGWGRDILIGGFRNDSLNGGLGNDWLDGGPGNDLVLGGEGEDTIVLRNQGGTDTILNFLGGSDRFALVNGLTFEQLSITENQQGISVSLTESGEQLAILIGDIPESLTADDFVVL